MTLRQRIAAAIAAYVSLPGKSDALLARLAQVGPSRPGEARRGANVTLATAEAMCAAIVADAPGSKAAALASFSMEGASSNDQTNGNETGTYHAGP